MSKDKKFIVTITGPSCAGKSTLAKMLVERGFAEIVSTTTRPNRDGEVDGVHYHFVSSRQFDEMQRNGEMVEAVQFGAHQYGCHRDDFEAAFSTGKPVAIVVEPNGARQIRDYAQRNGWLVFAVWVDNPLPIILDRFLQRFKDDPEADTTNYRDRLLHLMHTEIAPTHHDKAVYDMELKFFDGRNDKQVAHYISYVFQSSNGG